MNSLMLKIQLLSLRLLVSVVVEEIKFGDNDLLAALVTSLIDADLLLILTDTPGLFTADPRQDPSARLISELFQLMTLTWILDAFFSWGWVIIIVVSQADIRRVKATREEWTG